MPVPTDSINDNISLINSQGIIIKVRVGSIRNMGRSTQGVRVMRLRGSETLLLATSVEDSEDSEALEVEDQGTPNEENGDLEVSESPEEINESLDDASIEELNEEFDVSSDNQEDSVEDSDD
jgi:DNA gyrase subunit A